MFFLAFLLVASARSQQNCCCCDVSRYWDANRTWIPESECVAPSKCCSIPTQTECDIKLNPTFDTSCGHMNERQYQKDHGGPPPQPIPRPGYDNQYQLFGWLGQRFMDARGNMIEEWCFDNLNYDSFFLFRFVGCDQSYPHWFGRCAFPAATNGLLFESCFSNKFNQTMPSCFGAVQHMNIGQGSDAGRDIDYRFFSAPHNLSIWCTTYQNPKNPGPGAVYSGLAPGQNDGIVGFYLQECRQQTKAVSQVAGEPKTPEMSALKFRVAVTATQINGTVYEFFVDGNGMPQGYEAIVRSGDSLSLEVSGKVIVLASPPHWTSEITATRDGLVFLTFTYNGSASIRLNQVIPGFVVQFSQKLPSRVGWVARTFRGRDFNAFGSIKI